MIVSWIRTSTWSVESSCFDIKGPMTFRARLSNRYLINFVDRRSSFYRVFFAKTKVVAVINFKPFLVSFLPAIQLPHTRCKYRRWRRLKHSFCLQGNCCLSSSQQKKPRKVMAKLKGWTTPSWICSGAWCFNYDFYIHEMKLLHTRRTSSIIVPPRKPTMLSRQSRCWPRNDQP